MAAGLGFAGARVLRPCWEIDDDVWCGEWGWYNIGVCVTTNRLPPLQSCGQAIKAWETKNEAVAEEAETVLLYAQVPPITKLDNSLNTLKACTKLSLSTNSIDRISVNLNGLPNLKILALGRNAIKKIEKLEVRASEL